MGWQAWLLVAQPAPRRRENREAGTSDQIYDEAQFEAYRALGEVAGESFFTQDIIEGWNAGNVDEWFKPLASNLLPDNDEVFSSRKKRPKLPRRDFASLGSAGGGAVVQEALSLDLGNKDSLQWSYRSQAGILQACGRLEESMVQLKKQEAFSLELGDKDSLQWSYGNQAGIL
jgi:hypothetical protein